jgi:CubicO group peptidase (beta-lactamase class C family)
MLTVMYSWKMLFTLASNSKHFAAIAAGLALSQAGLTWETPVRAMIPSFQLVDKEAQGKITFIELLSHQSGLPRHDLSYE